MAESSRRYTCVICGRQVEYSGTLPELYPFCSARCKLIDLGRWFSEQYTIDADLPPELLDTPRDTRDPSSADDEMPR